MLLHSATLPRQRGPPKGGLQLDPVVARRVVAGSDHHSSGGLLVDDGIGNGGGGRIGARKMGYDAIARHHPRYLGSVPVG